MKPHLQQLIDRALIGDTTLAGMPVDPEDERWLALDAECDRMKEAFRRYGKHTKSCDAQLVRLNGQAQNCVCGFSSEWRRVFGTTRGV